MPRRNDRSRLNLTCSVVDPGLPPILLNPFIILSLLFSLEFVSVYDCLEALFVNLGRIVRTISRERRERPRRSRFFSNVLLLGWSTRQLSQALHAAEGLQIQFFEGRWFRDW